MKTDAAFRNDNAARAAIMKALDDLQVNAGKEGYRHRYDQALHIQVALKNAGLRVVAVPGKAKP